MTRMWKGMCKDEMCRQVVVFQEFECYATCSSCGQTHDTATLDYTVQLEPSSQGSQGSLHALLACFIQRVNHLPPRDPDLIKVMGYSHYHQKLVSHLLTTHGMDKHTSKARPLRQLTGRSTLDCSVFGDRSFRIETRHINIPGFGRDKSGTAYLAETLDLLKPYNDDKEVLVPLHADGDGHCLVHAVSRALVGRELFWHPLRVGLKQHFNQNIEKYKALLGNFINGSEWPCIIEECEPDYKPSDGSMVGLRNVHIFGLANLLRRPILLLDCMAGMKASADYAAVFLPGLNPPMACSNKAGQINPPICLAWSSAARNHYIPLVPIKENPLPKFPRHLLPKVWGFPQNLLESYIKFDEQNCFTIGGEVYLTQPYIGKLTFAMDELFQSRNGVPPSIVTDLFHYHYSTKLLTTPKAEAVIEVACATLRERRLLRCLLCNALCVVPVNSHSLRPGGLLYTAARKIFGFLREDYEYPFHNYGITCHYDTMRDILVVSSFDSSLPCHVCQGKVLRKIHWDGSVAYKNGDTTSTPVTNPKTNKCRCCYKHWWDGEEYDNPPVQIPISVKWNGKVVVDDVAWFQYESDPRLNSNVYDEATRLIQKHFPDEYGSERLHNSIVEQLLELTKDMISKEETTESNEVDGGVEGGISEAEGGLGEVEGDLGGGGCDEEDYDDVVAGGFNQDDCLDEDVIGAGGSWRLLKRLHSPPPLNSREYLGGCDPPKRRHSSSPGPSTSTSQHPR